jgi:hypothetical protein
MPQYKDGQTVWMIPIRFFDDNPPDVEECRIVGNQTADFTFYRQGIADKANSLYVYHVGYGHNVFIASPVFFDINIARQFSAQLKILHNLQLEDDNEQWSKEFLRDI